MDLGKLNHFVAVAEHRHFGRAAVALGVSQQALSKSIASLERELRVKLFERGAYGAVLTPYGEAMLRRAKIVDAELRLGRAEIESMRGFREGHVRIGAGLAFVGRVMPEVLLRMQAAHPGVTLSTWVESSAALFPMLLRGELDFVLSAPPLQFVVDSELRQERLFIDPDRLYVRTAHPLAKRRRLSLPDLQPYTWLMSAQMGSIWQRICREFTAAGLQPPEHVMYMDSTALAKEMIVRSNCVALLSRENVDTELAAGRMIELDTLGLGEQRVALITTRARSSLQPAAARCLDLAREVCFELHGRPP